MFNDRHHLDMGIAHMFDIRDQLFLEFPIGRQTSFMLKAVDVDLIDIQRIAIREIALCHVFIIGKAILA